MAQYSAQDGNATAWHMMHLGSYAVSGAALVSTEFCAVNPAGRISTSDLGLWCDDNMRALEPIVDFFRRHSNALFGVQLAHCGRKGSVSKFWEGHKPLTADAGGWQLESVSAVPYPGRPAPCPLDRPALKRLLREYAAAAKRADRIGVDYLELHAAHGYLLHSFLSPLSNSRDDEYGGGLENRMRFPLEVFRAIRDAWPAHKPIGVRISATDWIDGGWTLDDSVVFATRLREADCDYITASSGGLLPEQKIEVYSGYQVPFAKRIREAAGIPTIAVGLITEPRHADEVIRSGGADLVALGRIMLYNPRWPWMAAAELACECQYPPQYARAHPSMRRRDFFSAAAAPR